MISIIRILIIAMSTRKCNNNNNDGDNDNDHDAIDNDAIMIMTTMIVI